jgi:MFS family permease
MPGGRAEAASASVGRFPRPVWALSWTSLFSDWSYEMLLPILPFFLVYVLNAPIVVVGLVEGVAVFAQAVIQPVSSHFIRTVRGRYRGALAGYFSTTVAHGLLALAASWPAVFALRVCAWVGRGWRQPIKKTILSNTSSKSRKGLSFGLEQAFDSIGAVLGTTVAVLLLLRAGLAGSSRDIFALSVVPGLVAVLVFAIWVREPETDPSDSAPLGLAVPPSALPRPFRWFLVAATLFGLGFFNILLAVLDIGEGVQLSNPLGGGLSPVSAVVFALVVYLVYNLVYAGVSFPAGRLADRRPGIGLLAASYLLFLPVDLLLILESGVAGAVALMIGAGLQIALLDVVESTWISRAVPAGLTASAFGWFGVLRGLGTLVGSVLVGAIWEFVSVSLAFGVSAAFVVAASAILLLAVADEASPAT